MTHKRVKSGGVWASIRYSSKKAKEAGGILKLYKTLKKSNTCKTCAIGMGGKAGGLKNEIGDTFQVCKKSIQSQTQDMQPGIKYLLLNKSGVAYNVLEEFCTYLQTI